MILQVGAFDFRAKFSLADSGETTGFMAMGYSEQILIFHKIMNDSIYALKKNTEIELHFNRVYQALTAANAGFRNATAFLLPLPSICSQTFSSSTFLGFACAQ